MAECSLEGMPADLLSEQLSYLVVTCLDSKLLALLRERARVSETPQTIYRSIFVPMFSYTANH